MSKTPEASTSGTKTGKTKAYCKFLNRWLSEFKFVSQSKKGDKFAFCEVCNTDVSIGSGGRNDLTRHLQGKQHLLKANAVSSVDEQHIIERVNRVKRRGRVDYRKLSSGDTDWKPDNEEEKPALKSSRQKEPSTPVKGKESPVKSVSTITSSIETYLMMLYVTLEQENALKEFFQDNGWPFLKPDLSALTEKSGPTFFTNKSGNETKKSGNTPTTRQGKGQTDDTTPIQHTRIVRKMKQKSIEEEQADILAVNVMSNKKAKRGKSPEVSSDSENVTQDEQLPETMTDDYKLDGTESITEDNDAMMEDGDEANSDGKADIEGDTVTEKPSTTVEGQEPEPNEETKDLEDEGTTPAIKVELDESEGSEMMTDEESLDNELMGMSQIRCWICETILKDQTNYEEHMLKEHSFDVKKGRYYCTKCDKHFKQPDYLKDHNIHIHEGKKRKPQKTTRDHVCEICGRGFKRPDQLKEHRSMVHFKKPLTSHACGVCGKKFSRPRLLGYHMNKHIGTKPFQCTTCGNSYFSRGGLYVHSRTCQRLNPMIYECEICNKRFSNQYALKVHIKGIHSRTQVCYRCDCGKLLKYKTSIRRHRTRCPMNAEALTEITREEYEQCMASMNTGIVLNEEAEPAEIQVENLEVKDDNQVTEVTDEQFVEELTVKIADELNKSGRVNTEDEKLITDTIRNAVLSVDETQVIAIPRPSGTDAEDDVYYVIVNPPTDEQY